MCRFKAFSEVTPTGGLYPAPWRPEASAQIVVCNLDDVTDGGIGDCRIFPHTETGSHWHSKFAGGDVWLRLALAGRFQTMSPR